MIQHSQPKKKTPVSNDSILESLRGISQNISKTVSHDVVGKIPNDVLLSMFGSAPQSNELRQNQELHIPEHEQPAAYARPELIRRTAVRAEEKDLNVKIDAVRKELAALSASIKSLNTQIEKTVQEIPVQPGIYHLNFYERLKVILMHLRQSIDDSRTWLECWTNKKKQKMFWGLYKKHGTSFGLSSERTVATSAG
jgi:hypothetical protein